MIEGYGAQLMRSARANLMRDGTVSRGPRYAGSDVRLRVQVSDGAGPGDIVEGGIDNLSICSTP